MPPRNTMLALFPPVAQFLPHTQFSSDLPDKAFRQPLRHDLGGLVDGTEGPLPGARPVVVGPGGLIVHVVRFRKCQRLFPGNILRAVGQARVRRPNLVIGLGLTGGGIILSLAEDASSESNHRTHTCRILEKAPAIDGLAGKFIL